MYYVSYKKNGKTYLASAETEKKGLELLKSARKVAAEKDITAIVKKTFGTWPSKARLRKGSGYYNKTPNGWYLLDDSTIAGIGYTVHFYRLAERTIDPMCDAMNGWYAKWSKFQCVFEDANGKLTIIVPAEDKADHIWEWVCKAVKDDEHSEAHNVRVGFQSIIDFVKSK